MRPCRLHALSRAGARLVAGRCTAAARSSAEGSVPRVESSAAGGRARCAGRLRRRWAPSRAHTRRLRDRALSRAPVTAHGARATSGPIYRYRRDRWRYDWNTVSAKWVQQNSSFQSRILPQGWTATESGRLHAITFAEPTYGGNGGIDVKIEVS